MGESFHRTFYSNSRYFKGKYNFSFVWEQPATVNGSQEVLINLKKELYRGTNYSHRKIQYFGMSLYRCCGLAPGNDCQRGRLRKLKARSRKNRQRLQESRTDDIKEIAQILDAQVLYGQDMLDTQVYTACGSDMMSDVLACVKDQAVLLTGLVNHKAVRTALMMDMKCVCFVRGKDIDQKILDVAKQSGIVILSSQERMFSACGKLYSAGLKGGQV